MGYKLVVSGRRGTVQVFDLTRGMLIGREPACDIIIPDDLLSRTHCQLILQDKDLMLRDLNSKNGTFYHGRRIKEVVLRSGDVFMAGDHTFKILLEEELLSEGLVDFKTRTLSSGKDIAQVDYQMLREVKDNLASIYDISRIANSAGTLEELTSGVIEALCRVLDLEIGVIFLFDRSEGRLVSKAIASGKKEAQSLAFSKELIEKVFNHGGSILTEEKGTRMILCGIKGKTARLGVIYLSSQSPANRIGEGILCFLNSVSAIVGIAMENLLLRQRLLDENITMKKALAKEHGLVGDSPQMKRVYEFIKKASLSDAGVIVTGETGTGKELVARAIHYASRRAGRPFVVVNCGAIPEGLIENELFGHEKGAFTGAVKQRIGRFEEACGGTIFLDEIGELAGPAQVKLLRVLEEKLIQRIGSNKDIKVDVRVIAATNRPLDEMVRSGRFREDLFYRVSVLQIKMPPLREHPQDIPALVKHFLELFGSKKEVSKDAIDRLVRYSWPGNVRELRNVVERAVLFSKGDQIEPEDIVLGEVGGDISSLRLRDAERAHIMKVLRMADGNKSRAAELLGLDRSSLYAKIKNLGIVE
jgi:Nif-specific regulatory protein